MTHLQSVLISIGMYEKSLKNNLCNIQKDVFDFRIFLRVGAKEIQAKIDVTGSNIIILTVTL